VFAPRTLKILATLLIVFALLVFAVYQGEGENSLLETLAGFMVLAAYFSLFLFQLAAIPGVLEHGGHCGWAPCSPTPLGYALLAISWLALFWLVAWAAARLSLRWGRPT
jgi:hypothetical protein